MLPSPFGPRYHSQHQIISLPTIYSSSPLCYLPLLAPVITLSTLLSVSPQYTVLHPCVTFHFRPQISPSAPYYESPDNIQIFIPVLPSPFCPDITLSSLFSVSPKHTNFTPVLPSNFGPRFNSHHPIISLSTIYSSSPLCYLPLLASDITLVSLLSVSPQYTVYHSCVTFPFWTQISISEPYDQTPHNIHFFTPLLPSTFRPRYHSHHPIIISPQYIVLHSCVTFHFWPHISFSAPYYQSPHNIQFFIPVLPSVFAPRYHSQHPIMSLLTIYSSSPMCYLQIWPQISLSAPYYQSPQKYTVLHPSGTFHFWPQISLSAPYYQSPHKIQFFTPLLPSSFGPRYHTQQPIIRLPTIYSSSPLCYLPLLALDIILSTILSVSPQYTVLHPSATFTFWPQLSLSSPYYQSPHNIQFFTPVLPSHLGPRYHSQHPIVSLPTIYSSSFLCYVPLLDQISLSAPYYQLPHNIQIFTPVLPSTFGPRFNSHHPIISLSTIYSSSTLCYLPLLASDITLITILSVSPQYTVLHSCVTFPFWPQISLSEPYDQSPHNIHFFTPLLPSPFGPRYHSHHPIVSLPHNIHFFIPELPSTFGPRYHSQHPIISFPQYTVLHSFVTFRFCPQISLSTPYYVSPHNIHFFTPVLPSTFDPRYHSQHLLSVSPQNTVLHPCVTFPFGPRYHSQHPIIRHPKIYSS